MKDAPALAEIQGISTYSSRTKEQLIQEVEQLRKRKKYGLIWEDKPEDVVLQCQVNIPILKEVKSRKLVSDTSLPTNILIEGDNYHSLSVLNYTHKGLIDFIYIDPPYNRGGDFRYNDDYVDTEDSYRHSKWLSFMSKRLELAKTLLSDQGIIFISIDEHEFSALKLLCDDIFSTFESAGPIAWQKASGGGNSKKIVMGHEYILCYMKNPITLTQKNEKHSNKNYEKSKKYLKKNGRTYFINDDVVRKYFGKYPAGVERRCEYEDLLIYKNKDIKSEIDQKLKSGEFILVKNPGNTKKHFICALEEVGDTRMVLYSIVQGVFNSLGSEEFEDLGFDHSIFAYPKPTKLIKLLLDSIGNKNIRVLDFFAGSGTTGHAILDLNREDGGNRKFVLCTNNENKICEEVTYERIRRVMKGYKNKNGEKVAGIGGNLAYFKTDLVNVEKLQRISDESKIKITYQAGEMIALREDTLNEVEKNEWWQIFEGEGRLTAIYFTENKTKLKELLKILEKKNQPTTLYIFGWGKNEYKHDYSTLHIRVEDIPEPILEVYKEVNRI